MRALIFAWYVLAATTAAAQSHAESVCGMPLPRPAQSPPPGSAPMVVALVLCFDKQAGVSIVEPQTYLHYIEFRASEPSRQHWVPFDAGAERTLVADFQRLWATNFLDDLSIEALDYRFENGEPGKVIVFHLDERPRVRIVDYEGMTTVTRSDVAERLKERSIDLRLDSFLDDRVLRRVAAVIRELYSEKGHRDAVVTQRVGALPDRPKLAQVVFSVVEGPKVAIRDVEFIGNRSFTDAALTRLMKGNRPQGLLSLISGGGTYNAEKFADDAQLITAHYRNQGYIEAQVGEPQIRPLDDSIDGKTRWVQLRIDVTEGRRYHTGTFTIEGNTVVRTDALEPLFDLEEGEIYREERIRKGLEKARELYGSGGYFEFTAYPDLKPRAGAAEPIVDVTLRITEGKQYFIGRIEFSGNTHTRDSVIRRELGLVEGGIFNTEALKYSVRRINQLGYFKPLDESALSVERAPGTEDRVNIKLAVEEQNRNQLTFGAGASQYDGLFANFSYTTSNFLGRGESLTASLQTGTRSRNYQLSFSEPFLFGRAISAGGSGYSRKVDYSLTSAAIDYSEVRTGANVTTGLPWRRFSRFFFGYGYEVIDSAMTSELKDALTTDDAPLFVRDGRFIESSVTPSFVHNTVDNPFQPRRGKRLTVSYQYAGGVLGGTSHFVRPEAEGVVYVPVRSRMALGLRAKAGRIFNYGRDELPYYQRYVLGGEMEIRGVDVRTVGPLNSNNAALGGSSFALFNAEYYVDILPQVRALAFHDAGQAYADGKPMDLRQLRTSSGFEVRVTLPVINVPFRLIYAWNLYRDSFQPPRGFRFAVGTTF